MAPTDGPLSWQDEALLRVDRPDWMPSTEEIDAYLAEIRGARILVTGSEDWDDRRAIAGSLKRALKFLGVDAESSTLIHGASRGAELTTASLGRKLGMATESHPVQAARHSEDCPRQKPEDGGCWRGRSSCRVTGDRSSSAMIATGADILLAFVSEESADSSSMLELWLKDRRPAIICRQFSDGTVQGEFLNMDSWKD